MKYLSLIMPNLQNRKMLAVVCTFFLSLAIWCLRDAQAATTTSTVQVNIVSTVYLVAKNGIVFGDVSSSAIPGTVTISTGGARTMTGGTTVNSNTSGTPAKFEASGDPNGTYTITLSDSIVLTSAAGDEMVVNNFSSTPEENGQLDSSGRQDLNVGATLNVGSFQPFGTYTGLMSATAEYN
jgi:hypothetical protein